MLFFRSRRRRLSLSSLLLPHGADYNAHESIIVQKTVYEDPACHQLWNFRKGETTGQIWNNAWVLVITISGYQFACVVTGSSQNQNKINLAEKYWKWVEVEQFFWSQARSAATTFSSKHCTERKHKTSFSYLKHSVYKSCRAAVWKSEADSFQYNSSFERRGLPASEAKKMLKSVALEIKSCV